MRRPVVLAALLGAAFGAAGVALGAFSATTSNPAGSFTTKRIYAGNRFLSPHDLRDASSGAETNSSNPFAFVDGIVYQSAAAMSSGSNVYIQFDLNTPRPAGLSVSGAQLNITLASQGGPGAGNACAYAAVYSGATLLGTHGSYASPIGCSSGNTQTTLPATSLPEVTSTDQANGVSIRLYLWEASGKKIRVDRVTVTGTDYASFTLYPRVVTDNSSGPTVTTWSLSSADAVTYTSTNNWPSAAPTSTTYLKLTLDPAVPGSATLQSATLTHIWAPSSNVTNSGTLCYYLETYNGATLLGTHGGSTQATALSCDATTSATTDTVTLGEVNTPAKANALVIKLYYWGAPNCGGIGKPGCVKSVTDQLQVTLNYYLD